jgi:hypothetical protein
MKRFYVILIFFVTVISSVLQPRYVFGDVLGTSVTVTEAFVDIKNVDTQSRGGVIDSEIDLENTSQVPEKVDRVDVTISGLDGTIRLKESVDIVEELKPFKQSFIKVKIPNDLNQGRYVGFYELYSENRLLGQSKTIIEIPQVDAQVLGAATEANTLLLWVFSGVFVTVLLISLFIFINNPNWLSEQIKFRLTDILFLIAGLSAFGLGFCVGYFLAGKYLPSEISAIFLF